MLNPHSHQLADLNITKFIDGRGQAVDSDLQRVIPLDIFVPHYIGLVRTTFFRALKGGFSTTPDKEFVRSHQKDGWIALIVDHLWNHWELAEFNPYIINPDIPRAPESSIFN